MFQAQTFLPVSQLDLGFILMEDNFKLPKRVFTYFETVSTKMLFFFFFFLALCL